MDEENRSTTTTSYSKEIVNIAKIYTKKQKYGNTNKSLNCYGTAVPYTTLCA